MCSTLFPLALPIFRAGLPTQKKLPSVYSQYGDLTKDLSVLLSTEQSKPPLLLPVLCHPLLRASHKSHSQGCSHRIRASSAITLQMRIK